MRVGDLVRNLNSECGLLGIVVGWENIDRSLGTIVPMVRWNDGRTSWVMPHLVTVIS